MLFLNVKEKESSVFMCTAVSLTAADRHYFARTLDLEYHYNEAVTLTPRRYPFSFTDGTESREHSALLGMAYVVNGYPLYYDAMNEHGLCMAGLAYAHFCTYARNEPSAAGHRIAPWELIPHTLIGCRTVNDARALLSDAVLVDRPFSDKLQNQPMHWMIADSTASIVLETDTNGKIIIYDNPADVMTNAPTFPEQMEHLSKYAHLTPHPKTENGISMRGMGAFGLPGDWSSPSRFVRASFLRRHMLPDRASSVFPLLDAVKVPRGVSLSEDGQPIVTVYSAVMEPNHFCYRYRWEQDSVPHICTPSALQMRGTSCVSLSSEN